MVDISKKKLTNRTARAKLKINFSEKSFKKLLIIIHQKVKYLILLDQQEFLLLKKPQN